MDTLSSLPLVSVIIPVFNDQNGLNVCIQYLCDQDFDSSQFEIIVVDNGSNTLPQIASNCTVTIKLIVCNTPGSYAARNTGAKIARGKILAFTDADCMPCPEWLKNGTAALGDMDRNCIVGGEVELIQFEQPTTVELYQCLTGFAQKENIQLRRFSATANLFVYKDHFKRVTPFDESLLSCGDREWCWRAEKLGFTLIYEPSATVKTYPRKSLQSAVRQARRVAGGRYHLRSLGIADSAVRKLQLGQRRSAVIAMKWIFAQSRISYWDRLRLLTVAAFLRLIQSLETLRLQLGGQPERR